MLGYVTIEKSELKIREYDVYQAYYCGICKSVGNRLGQVPRMALSFDLVFLALILSGLEAKEDKIKEEHCIIHHIKKKPVAFDDSAIDYAADMMVILAYHKFLDDWKDERSASGFMGKTALKKSYSKVAQLYPKVCHEIEISLERLSKLEAQLSGNLDILNEVFADVMEILFVGFDGCENDAVLRELGRSLGKWIYTVDAFDDLDEDLEKGQYNPLKYRKAGKDGIEGTLYHYLSEISNAYDLLDIKKNNGILDNIIFMGLRRRTEVVLRKGTRTDEQSI